MQVKEKRVLEIRTLSIFQQITIGVGSHGPTDKGIPIMPPDTLEVFRATVINNLESRLGPPIYVNTTNDFASSMLLLPRESFIFERRGVGYMDDQFYFWYNGDLVEAGVALIIWEGVAQ